MTIAAATLAGAPLSAHVTLSPREAPAKAYQAFAVRVPTERDSATVSVRLELPASLKGVRLQPKPGWKYEIERDSAGAIIAVTWSGGRIGRDEYEEFHFVVRMPDKTGTLTFRAHQKYEDGETVAWVETEGKRPAPRVRVTAPR